MIKNKQAIGGVAIAGVLAMVTLLGSTGSTSLLANTASANYGGGGGSSPRVEICHNGQTIKVAKRAVDAHLAHGDTTGPCLPQAQVLGASTTVEQQAQIQSLQMQLVTLLQQLLTLLKAQ